MASHAVYMRRLPVSSHIKATPSAMKHTNIALQNIGLKVSDADAIMLDLDEAQTDIQDVQNSMSSSFANDEDQFDLEAELTLMLSEDALLATLPKNKAPANTKPTPVPDTKLLLPEVAQSTGRPPDEPPGAAEVEDSSAPLPVLYTDAVAPVSTMNPRKTPSQKKASATTTPTTNERAWRRRRARGHPRGVG
jgi:hypothetical protein